MREWSARFGENASVSSAPSSSDTASGTASDTTPNTTSSTVSSDETEPVLPVANRVGKTAFVSAKTIIGRKNELNAMMTELKNSGYESVALEMKPESGILPYLTKSEFAKQYKLVDASAVEPADIVTAAVNAGLQPLAYISALKDYEAPHVSRENSYAYSDSLEVNWLDNSVALGGKPWLNPYMKATGDYIKELVVELHTTGFGTILLDNVIYPEKNTAKMNTILTTPSREQALNLFVAEVEAELPDNTLIRVADAAVTLMEGDGSADAAFSRIPSQRIGMELSLARIETNKEAICKNAGIPADGYTPDILASAVAAQLIQQAKTKWETEPCIVIHKSEEAQMLPILENHDVSDYVVIP